MSELTEEYTYASQVDKEIDDDDRTGQTEIC